MIELRELWRWSVMRLHEQVNSKNAIHLYGYYTPIYRGRAAYNFIWNYIGTPKSYTHDLQNLFRVLSYEVTSVPLSLLYPPSFSRTPFDPSRVLHASLDDEFVTSSINLKRSSRRSLHHYMLTWLLGFPCIPPVIMGFGLHNSLINTFPTQIRVRIFLPF